MTPEEKRIKNILRLREWRKKHPERIRQRQEKWKKNNPEKVRQQQEKYRKNNPEKVRQQQEKWRKNNPEKVRQQQEKYYKEHLEKVRQRQEKYRKEHSEEIRQYQEKYYKEHPEKVRQYKKKYRKAHLEKVRQYQEKYHKAHPEIKLKSNIKLMKKLGSNFGLTNKKYKYAQMSWTKTVRKMNGNYCAICGSTHGLNSHHIFPKILHPKLSLNIHNGIPLCKEHHWEVHRLNPIQMGWAKK